VLSAKTKLQEILTIAPEWKAVYDRLLEGAESPSAADKSPQKAVDGTHEIQPFEFFERLGAKAIYLKALSLDKSDALVALVRDYYYQPMFAKMLTSNHNLRRFWSQRKIDLTTQKSQALSMSTELAAKLEQAFIKHITQRSEDGFKVLLPAYAQRSVHNAVVDYVRHEWQWEKDTLQDVNLDPELGDPRANVADDIRFSPESQAISGEQVTQLNELRLKLKAMLGNKNFDQEPLAVIDCMFGLGLTPKSRMGEEMTMRECCDVLDLKGDTQARKIARCQVLLDKGLDMIRDVVRRDMPGVAQSWQADINLNSASRRELNHHLGLTEGEVDRLIANRQYYGLEDLIDKGVLKRDRLPEIGQLGAVVAFIPVDLNSATRRDIIDIIGCEKEASKKLVDSRPFASLKDIVEKKILDKAALDKLIANGAVLKVTDTGAKRLSLNHASLEELTALGLSQDHSARLLRARPFATWGELEDFLCVDSETWTLLRERSCLTMSSQP
jgi:hypothetical protein